MPKKSRMTRFDKELLIALALFLIGLILIIESLATILFLCELNSILQLTTISITSIYIILKLVAGIFSIVAGLIFLKRR